MFVSAVPNPRADVPRVWAQRQTEAGRALPELSVLRADQAAVFAHGEEIVALAQRAGNVIIVDPFRSMCDANTCSTVKNGRSLFRDTDHLTMDGVQIIAPDLSVAIASAYRSIAQEPR